MSYVALATDQFEEVVKFYGKDLHFPVVEEWDRSNGRGRRFDIGGGLLLEILDNPRERQPLPLKPPADRFHVVVEVTDIEAARRQLRLDTPPPTTVSWGAQLFRLRDPDGVAVTFLQWNKPRGESA